MKKGLNRAMRPFTLRLIAEAVMRAACASGLFVLPVWLMMALVRRILGWGSDALSATMLLAWAALFAALYAARYRVTRKKAACRLDALCGMDRIATAVEFAGDDSVLCRMQREDAVRRLEKTDPRALRIALPVSSAAVCIVFIAAIAAVPLIPQSGADAVRALAAKAVPALVKQESEESAALRQMIESLRTEVEESGIKDADKTALLARLEELAKRLGTGFVDIAALQEIRDAMAGMQETVRELTPRDTYMAAMIEFESLRLLGEAIFDENMDVVIMILDSFGRQLHEQKGMAQVNALMNLVYDINASLAKPLRDNRQDQLRQGMMAFAGGLENAAEMVYSGRDNTKMIDTALDTAKVYIREYLGVPEEGERYDPFANRVYEQTGDSSGSAAALAAARAQEEKVLKPSETEYVYDPPKALKASTYVPGALNAHGEPQRMKADERERAPGAVPYGEVYGDYYAAYLAQLSEETFPQELRGMAEAYMNGL